MRANPSPAVSYKNRRSPSARPGHPHTVKLQLPIGGLTDRSSLLGYTRLLDRIFEVRPADNRQAFTELVSAIRERGQVGGLKGYFNAWAASPPNIDTLTQELDIDARCMKPAQAF